MTKIGNIYKVKVDESTVKYLQYIVVDKNQLNSEVVRVFKETYPIDASIDTLKIITGDVDFYAHCSIRLGVKFGYWTKVGNSKNVGSPDILFRDTNDYGSKSGEQINLSTN